MSDGQKPERAASFPRGTSPAMKIDKVTKEPDVKCPVCGGRLERLKTEDGASRATCPSCRFTWFRRG